MRAMLGFAVLCLAALQISAKVKDGYKGYQVFAVTADTEKQMEFLIKMSSSIDAYDLADEVDFLTEPSAALLQQKGHVLLMLSPGKREQALTALDGEKISYKVAIADLAKAIEEESRVTPEGLKAAAAGEMSWENYQNYATIEKFVKKLAADYPEIVSIKMIGKTYEGRDMYVLKIGKPRADGRLKPAIWMDSHIHAREWIASATTTWMVNKLVTQYGTNQTCTTMVDQVDWYYLPMVNPDGVEHTRANTNNRMWRRTRRVNPFSPCIGADPNRNYDFFWMYNGANQSPCSDIYAGSWPLSEVENVHLTDAVLEHKGQIKMLLTVHSSAQMWLLPWGYGNDRPDDFGELMTMGNAAVMALTSQFGTPYRVGSSTDLLGAAAGATDDWGKAKGQAKYSYTVELRDRGTYSFILPPNQIIPSGIETFEALVVCAQRIVQEYGLTLN